MVGGVDLRLNIIVKESFLFGVGRGVCVRDQVQESVCRAWTFGLWRIQVVPPSFPHCFLLESEGCDLSSRVTVYSSLGVVIYATCFMKCMNSPLRSYPNVIAFNRLITLFRSTSATLRISTAQHSGVLLGHFCRGQLQAYALAKLITWQIWRKRRSAKISRQSVVQQPHNATDTGRAMIHTLNVVEPKCTSSPTVSSPPIPRQ